MFSVTSFAFFLQANVIYDAQHGNKALKPYVNSEGLDEQPDLDIL